MQLLRRLRLLHPRAPSGRLLQCRDEEWIGKTFFAKYDPKAVWFDDLEALDGMELPWEAAGLPRPCIDEPCQIEWMDEYLSPAGN